MRNQIAIQREIEDEIAAWPGREAAHTEVTVPSSSLDPGAIIEKHRQALDEIGIYVEGQIDGAIAYLNDLKTVVKRRLQASHAGVDDLVKASVLTIHAVEDANEMAARVSGEVARMPDRRVNGSGH
jgi:hypothetical protein